MFWGTTNTPKKSEKLLNHFGMSPVDAVLQSSNYEANGFVGAFTLNVLGMKIPAPKGYTQNAVTDAFSEYKTVYSDENSVNADVILVLSESFFDARVLPGVSFSEKPLANYDRLLQSEYCQSGYIYTTAVGGGTVRTEFSILTGMTTDYLSNIATPYSYIKREIPTYVSNYKDAGYKILAIHPYDKKLHSTPFLIYSNFVLKGGLFSATKDTRVSDYNLMNHVAKSTGMISTPYMELLSEFHDVAPYYIIMFVCY